MSLEFTTSLVYSDDNTNTFTCLNKDDYTPHRSRARLVGSVQTRQLLLLCAVPSTFQHMQGHTHTYKICSRISTACVELALL